MRETPHPVPGLKHERILVTGGASFLGSHLVELLVANGATVVVADDLSSGRREHLDAVARDVELLVGDLRDADFAARAARDAETVFHLAAMHGGRGSQELDLQVDKPVGVRSRASDDTRSLELLGWEPSTPLAEGVARTIDWYLEAVTPDRLARLETLLMTR